jgi:uncharacterized protein
MLLDTSGLLCLLNKAEPFHEEAREFYKVARKRVTHTYVLAEFIALATARRLPRKTTLMFVVDLLNNPDIEMLWTGRVLDNEAMSLLLKREDKTYSFCDAVSFTVMHQQNLGEALTTDHHFTQEGFKILL